MKFITSAINKIKKEPPRIILISFLILIFLGSILLSMPFSVEGSNSISYTDALFTSASATCVTGLVVLDTATYFTLIGKTIILILIQIGGLGVMTFSTFFIFYLRGKFGIDSREIIQETLSSDDIVDIDFLLKAVFIFTLSMEAFGAFLLFIRFSFDMPFTEAIYSAVFHSVSAFCNAGFSIFSNNLVNYQSDFFVNFIIMVLVISGGIGFIVIYEIVKHRKKINSFYSLSLHAKVVISVTAVLILVGTIFIFIFEYNVSFKGYNFFTKILASLFQSVTARTAGFNTVDIHALSLPSILIIIALMFVGASPASCGGGIKTTTVAVIFSFIRSRIKDVKNVNLFYNTLSFKLISKAIVIAVFGISTVLVFSFFVSIIELNNAAFYANGNFFIEIIFEVVSAFGTVGLSTGITSQLSFVSECLIIIVMIIGRVGPLTIALSVGSKETTDIKYVEENILTG